MSAKDLPCAEAGIKKKSLMGMIEDQKSILLGVTIATKSVQLD